MAAPDGRDGALTLHQDVRLWAGTFAAGESASLDLAAGRRAWVQVAGGAVEVNGTRLDAGDGAALTGESALRVSALDGTAPAEVLVFDLA